LNASLSGLTPRIPIAESPGGFWLFVFNIGKKVTFFALHLACLAVFFVPVTTTALVLCFSLYFIRMFGITAGYHRYFAHRAYKTSRWFQFVLAWLGCSALQRGPLWWAAVHRHHHKYSDTDDDAHSPITQGVWWSHVGWVISVRDDKADLGTMKDFKKYPEIRFLDDFHWIPGLVLAILCYVIDGWSGVVWGAVVSTVLLYHGTFLVNSVCHIFGSRRYNTNDQSKNNFWVALATLGEGWHNNHHHYMSSANQGFKWWEIDISYYILKVLSWPRIVWDLRKPPANKLIPTAVN
jgi:stearoyl-CoA desaturase (Delta-9 desaturase)